MIFAYADPPYIGQAKKHYAHDPKCAEVDHPRLIREMCERYDGWALSLSSTTLQRVLCACPAGVRVGAWVKPFAAFKANVNPAYAWEPVIFFGGRKRTRKMPTERDWIAESITMRRGLTGAKPRKFCFWVFEMFGMNEADVLIDLFPGTGAVSHAYTQWREWKGFNDATKDAALVVADMPADSLGSDTAVSDLDGSGGGIYRTTSGDSPLDRSEL